MCFKILDTGTGWMPHTRSNIYTLNFDSMRRVCATIQSKAASCAVGTCSCGTGTQHRNHCACFLATSKIIQGVNVHSRPVVSSLNMFAPTDKATPICDGYYAQASSAQPYELLHCSLLQWDSQTPHRSIICLPRTTAMSRVLRIAL